MQEFKNQINLIVLVNVKKGMIENK